MHNNLEQCKSCAMDMLFSWIHEGIKQDQYNVYWQPGKFNKADYITKHHAPSDHTQKWPTYLYKPNYIISLLRGCVNRMITDTRERTLCLTNHKLIDAHTRALYPNNDIYPFLGLVFQ